MKIFVTGGAGFIGKNLVEFLLKENNQVTIFDNFSNSSKDNIKIFEKSGAKIVEGDITDKSSINRAIKGNEFVIHLAAKISVQESIRNPTETFRVNVEGTKNLLYSCSENNIRNFIGASSAAVYKDLRDPNEKLFENSPTGATSSYGESKIQMEKEIINISKKHDINSIILRFFNIYGPGQSREYAGVISKFIQNIHDEVPLTIFGDGNQTRDFVAIKDAINAISLAMKNISGKKGAIYNIGSERSITINDLAKLILSISDKQLPVLHSEPKTGEIRYSKTSIEQAKKELNFYPSYNLSQEINKLL